jgi:hypothetical protein
MTKKKIDVVEELKLRWPDGCERTRIKERKPQPAWKKTRLEYHNALILELEKMGATSILISRGIDERLDAGVAVWFSMKKEDFSWQQGLSLDTPAPTLDEIDIAFREKAKAVHPDRSDGGDPEMFKKLANWRTAAKAWITGTHAHQHEYVMAIDQYTETRLNLCALRLAFSYIRGLERVGAPAILTQTLGAFRAKLTATSGGQNVIAS